jgi:hypothetical protein
MVLAVDFGFIRKLEGHLKLKGYVPEVELSNSGVTIASGVDLGQRNENSMQELDITDDLRAKLSPYLGAKKHDAVSLLEENPLEISEHEAESLDKAVVEPILNSLVAKFDAASQVAFEELEPQKQTAIASVAFQYGTGLSSATPNFWRPITTGDWNGALANLRNFGDDYPTRRNKEAALLQEVVAA